MTAKPKRIPWNKGLKGKQVAWNKGIPSGYKGIPRTEETRKAISEAKKGKPNGLLGRTRTLQERINISIGKKGKPSPLKGIKRNKDTLLKFKYGKDNVNWKGDEVGYAALHDWVTRKLGTPNVCNNCSEVHNRCHWHNVSKRYKRDLTDWVRLCPRCHTKAEMEHGTLYGPKKSS